MKKKKRKDAGWYALFTVPLLFVFATIVLIPFFIGVGYSFFSWDGLPLNPKIFVGMKNYVHLFSDSRFMTSAGHTLIFTVFSVLLINVIGLAFALIVTTKLKVRNAARAMLFMPYLIGGLILGYIWKFILGDGLSYVAEVLGSNSKLLSNWLLDSTMSMVALVVVSTWQMAGYIMII